MTDAPLLATTEAFARELLADAGTSAHDDTKPPLVTRIAALKAVTSFLAVKNKLDPPDEKEEDSPVAEFQRELAAERLTNGGARRPRRDPIAKNETLTSGEPAGTA